jgi:hypothetical protein
MPIIRQNRFYFSGRFMKHNPIVLDHVNGIQFDSAKPPFNNYQVFQQTLDGLVYLANHVRSLEVQAATNDPHAHLTTILFSSQIPPYLGSVFNWYAVSLTSYLRLIALVDLMQKKGWQSDDLADKSNKKIIKPYGDRYVESVVPDIKRWRDKVAAHFAASDPRPEDTLATLELTIMNPIAFHCSYYYAGFGQ